MNKSNLGSWTIRDLRCAIAVSHELGFRAAAKRLDMAPSSVARSVAKLEEDLGVSLFTRTTRSVRLTESGRKFISQTEIMLRQIEAAVDEVHSLKLRVQGRLRVACSATLGAKFLVPRLKNFYEAFPKIEVDLRLSDQRVDLIREEMDLAIRVGELPDSTLRLHKLANEQRWLYASPQYLANFGSPKLPSDLRAHQCLFLDNDRRWKFKDRGHEFVVEVDSNFRTDLGQVLVEAAIEGMGIARLSAWAAHEALQSGKLVLVLPEFVQARCGVVGALYPSSHEGSQKLKVFLRFLDQQLAPVLRQSLMTES